MEAYIYNQCKNAIASAQLFEKACTMAASRDGAISKEEQKTLKQINTAVTKYIVAIEKLIQKEK